MTKSSTKESKKPISPQIIIAILATALVCSGIFLAIALGTGILKFSSDTSPDDTPAETTPPEETPEPTTISTPTPTSTSAATYDNPNPKVKINGRKVSIKDLEFYVPTNFTEATKAGGDSDFAVTYNLTNDDGWADLKIYVKKTDKDARDFLLEKNKNFTISQDTLIMNSWPWSEACAASCAIQAWATNYGDYVYAIILTIKLDSDSTSSASSMIPKTLYFEKLYK